MSDPVIVEHEFLEAACRLSPELHSLLSRIAFGHTPLPEPSGTYVRMCRIFYTGVF